MCPAVTEVVVVEEPMLVAERFQNRDLVLIDLVLVGVVGERREVPINAKRMVVRVRPPHRRTQHAGELADAHGPWDE
jgi:hypothetical protein